MTIDHYHACLREKAERIAARVLAEHDEEHRTAYRFGSPVAAMSAARKIATAAALVALTETLETGWED